MSIKYAGERLGGGEWQTGCFKHVLSSGVACPIRITGREVLPYYRSFLTCGCGLRFAYCHRLKKELEEDRLTPPPEGRSRRPREAGETRDTQTHTELSIFKSPPPPPPSDFTSLECMPLVC